MTARCLCLCLLACSCGSAGQAATAQTAPPTATSAGAPWTWVEERFADFVDGEFDDGGVELYATAANDVRFVNQFDFNQDGAVDLVFCNTHDTVEKPDALIYWNKGGQFSTRHATPLPTDGAYSCQIDDLDADGWPELIIINRDNGITTTLPSFIYWGGHDGYSPARRSEVTTFNPGRCAVADLDGDGRKDLIIPNGTYSLGEKRFDGVGVRIHWATAQGFTDYATLDLGGNGVTCVATGHFAPASTEAAAGPDVFVGMRNGPSRIYANSAGGLDRQHFVELDVGPVVQAVVLDWDGDGRDDLLVNPGPGAPLRLFTQASGSSAEISDQKLGVPGAQAVAVADLDADGRHDLILAGVTPTESRIAWGAPGGFSPVRITPIATTHATDVAVADLNGDGHPDVVLAQQMDDRTFDIDTLILWGDGTRAVGEWRTALPGHGTMGLAIGDLNADGDPDVVLTGRIGGLRTGRVPTYVYWNDGRGGFDPQHRTDLITNDNYEAAAADLNLDGHVDLVFAEQYETQGEIGESHIFWGAADGFRQERSTGLMTHGPLGVSIADLNRDGWLDIVFGQLDRVALTAERRAALPRLYLETVFGDTQETVPGRGRSRIFWGSANGFSLQAMTELQTSGAGTPTIADFNRDGWLDIVFPNGRDHTGAWLYWGSAAGFDAAHSTRLCFERGSKAEAVDLDGDGWLDLIFVIRVKGLTKDTDSLVYLGGPDGFDERRRLELPTRGAGSASVHDLNRDGRLDVLLTNYTSNTTRQLPLYIYWGSADGWSQVHRTSLPAQSGSGSLVADFNADDWLDIAVACHRREGSLEAAGLPNTHVARSFIYWGSAGGFDPRRRLELPTIGPHGMLGVDAGHVYHRRGEWMYVSSRHDLPHQGRLELVAWRGDVPEGTELALQARMAATADELKSAPWSGPAGPDSWFLKAGDASDTRLHGTVAQYRVRFRAPRCARFPSLSRVALTFQRPAQEDSP